ncbi:MAG: hypothetical protein N3D18_05680 [Roseococcus sp.]|nr:hypothetical protein [Roseococcus sp.]
MRHPLAKVGVLGFACGALAFAAFHQGTQHVLHNTVHNWPALAGALGPMPGPGWNLAPLAAPPLAGLAIPVLAAQLLWGGAWGVLIAAAIRWAHLPDLLTGALMGGLGATLAASLGPVSPEGLEPALDAQSLLRCLLLNGGFGFGAALLMRPFGIQRPLRRGH